MSKFFKHNVDNNRICHIVLNRKPINALSYDFLNDLKNTIKNLNNDNNVSVIIFSSGIDNFSAGADLKERSIMNSKDSQKSLDNFNDCFNVSLVSKVRKLVRDFFKLLSNFCIVITQ